MKLSAYSEIISAAEKQNYNRNCVQYLSGIYPSISNETLYSIVSQAYQRYTKKSYPQHHSSAAVEAYYNAYSEAAGTEPPEEVRILKRIFCGNGPETRNRSIKSGYSGTMQGTQRNIV
ncbi:PREDICTED: uncharacterized protein C15orf41-like [Priapulus caudatus]|uniref:CDAN1-interacting nuclease 1 n=1 Tax=Priapulus caudatus TaxID=37621 RepID=A0ABM1ECP0_PRICU|nr:PREDICTED: uncharacterized protein C15orf41-like [Priapulus caudatus]